MERYKICAKCKKSKKIDEFNKSGMYDTYYPKYANTNTIRYCSRCKECTKQYRVEYYGRNGIINYKTLKHKESKNKRDKLYRDNNVQYRLSHVLRTRLNIAIRNKYKAGSAVKDLGCSIEKFKLWIEMHWQDGMNWNNYGKWHLDHIKPLSSFNLSNREEFIIACNFSNIQPLWAHDNLIKHNKV